MLVIVNVHIFFPVFKVYDTELENYFQSTYSENFICLYDHNELVHVVVWSGKTLNLQWFIMVSHSANLETKQNFVQRAYFFKIGSHNFGSWDSKSFLILNQRLLVNSDSSHQPIFARVFESIIFYCNFHLENFILWWKSITLRWRTFRIC